MKVQETKDGHDVKITFIPENEEEQRIMGTLRNHFFYGMPEQKTYPDYAGITTANNFVTSLSMNFKSFDENVRIRLTKCVGKLPLVKAIVQVTGKSLLESKNIADQLISFDGLENDWKSVTPEQWKEIVKQCPDVEFEYI